MLIEINIKEKRAQVLGSPVIVCGNTDNIVEFTFDEEWAAFQTRTARFVYIQGGAVKYTDVVFTGDTVAVPSLSDTKEVRVGVFAGDLHTTTPARIPCELSILCGTGSPAEPTPSQYDQLMALLNEKSALDAVRFATQELGEAQKAVARTNIGAASQDDLEAAQANNLLLAQELQRQFQTADQGLSQRLDEIMDSVIDSGKVGAWNYQMYDSGICECWCEQNVIFDSETLETGTLFDMSSVYAVLPLQVSLNEDPCCWGSIAYAGPGWANFGARNGNVTICLTGRANQGAMLDAITTGLSCSILVKGRWK